MLALSCFSQLKFSTAPDHLALESDIMFQAFFQGQDFRLAIDQRQHNHADRFLHLGVAVKLVEHYLGICVPLQVDHEIHPVPVRMVLEVGNPFNLPVFYVFRNGFNQPGFIDHIGQLGHDDPEAAVRGFLNFRPGAQGNFPPAGRIGGTDP